MRIGNEKKPLQGRARDEFVQARVKAGFEAQLAVVRASVAAVGTGAQGANAVLASVRELLAKLDSQHIQGPPITVSGGQPFTEQAVTETLEEVPAEQLILAIPFYTRLWKADGSSTAIGAARLQALLAEWQADPVWSETQRQYICSGTLEGENVSVWIEDLDTLGWRLELAKQYRLAGVSGWKAGMEQEEAWDLMQAYGAEMQ